MEETIEAFPVHKYTVQLYYVKKRESNNYEDAPPPEQIASGVLVRWTSKYFLITCKHVFENINIDDVVILTSDGFAVRLPNKIKFIDDEKRSIDLAMIEFHSYRLEELKSHFSFLPSKNLGFGHEFEEELFYMLYGYINKKTTREGFSFFDGPFGYLTGIRNYKKFEEMGFSYENNITLEYNRRKQSYLYDEIEKKSMGPKDLKGLSGGGIWLSVEGKKPDTYEYILVGIMIEERIDRGFVIGTKIELIEKHIAKP